MNEPDIVEQNISQIDISHEKSEDDFLEELPSKSSEIDELELPTEKGGEEKEIGIPAIGVFHWISLLTFATFR